MAKNQAAVELGRLGGLAKSARMTDEEKLAAASKAGKVGGWPAGKPRGPRKPKS